LVNAEPQPGLEGFSFEQAGDIVDVVNVLSLQLESLDEENGEWGVALMKLQASLPDTLPGQNVTFVLFGNVEIENAVEPAPQPVLLDVTANGNANVRGEPSTNGAIVGSLSGGQVITGDGRNEAGDWLHIQLDGGTGWVFADLVTVDGEVNSLLVVEGDEVAPSQKPMQSFYFRSGFGDAPCEQAPDSGILIQTPEGAGQVAFTVNGVDIQLGSTTYLQAQPNEQLTVNLIEGSAQVSAQDTVKTVPAGTRVNVPMDDNLEASGPPSDPEPYDSASLGVLPITLLEREIEIAPALTQEEIAARASFIPVSGEWLVQPGAPSLSGTCPEGASAGTSTGESSVITLNVTGEFGAAEVLQQIMGPPAASLTMVYDNPEPGLYTVDITDSNLPGGSSRMEVRFTSPTQAEAFFSLTLDGCTNIFPFTMTAQ
jgi:hypothetical protein